MSTPITSDPAQSSCSYRFISSSLTHLPSSREYDITIRQQPVRAKMSVINERDRRPIEPPPILQMKWLHCSPEETKKCLQSPFYFLVANLVDVAHGKNELLLPAQDYLSGTTVSSLYRLRDIDNKDGGFYVFGDLSVKQSGEFKLQFSLFEIVDQVVQNRQTLLSSPFKVYLPKHFPGPLEATFLSRTFSDQGVKMRIRKEHRLQTTTSTTRKRKTTDRRSSPANNENELNTNTVERDSKRKLTPPSYAPPSQDVHFGRFLSGVRKSSTTVTTTSTGSMTLNTDAMDIDDQHRSLSNIHSSDTNHTSSSSDHHYQPYQHREPWAAQTIYPSPQHSTDLTPNHPRQLSTSSSSSSSVWTQVQAPHLSSSSSSSSSSMHVTTPPSPTYSHHYTSSPPTVESKYQQSSPYSVIPVNTLASYHLSSSNQQKLSMPPASPPSSLCSHPSSSLTSMSSLISSVQTTTSPPVLTQQKSYEWGSKLPPLRAIMTDHPTALKMHSQSIDHQEELMTIEKKRSCWQLPPPTPMEPHSFTTPSLLPPVSSTTPIHHHA
ncbi:velvet factor-domain-containing protein [Halteromyces radiatus]|uniref:velvet factor-domain-containing protein n=1 Tax=Halteromyces radiatus TaxID=101107 RepID=UPI0022201FD4|nr:velvet factor-domain-containing protein [Halteromyces radiatus]KAI8089255.1 velvet factor-domain-containing protein [Halteromyces radiatus]